MSSGGSDSTFALPPMPYTEDANLELNMGERLVTRASVGVVQPSFSSQTCFDVHGDLFLQTFPDCTLFCVASEKLYEEALDPGSMFAAARAADDTSGRDSAHPILLLNVDAARFETLYNYIYNIGYPEPDDLEGLIDLLRVGFLFTLFGAITYAVGELGRNADLTPPVQVYLARHFGVNNWLRSALRTLATRPLQTLSSKEIDLIGADVLKTLIRVQAALAAHRMQLVTDPPIGLATCRDESICLSIWLKAWARYAARTLSNAPLGAALVPLAIEDLTPPANPTHPTDTGEPRSMCFRCSESHRRRAEELLVAETQLIDINVDVIFAAAQISEVHARILEMRPGGVA